jgi:transcriptional regulator with XRE-family HTH domain
MNALIKCLKKARAEHGLTQGDIAKKLGYTTPQFVSNWERGLSVPPLDALPKLSKILDIEQDKLVNLVFDARILRLEDERNEVLEAM